MVVVVVAMASALVRVVFGSWLKLSPAVIVIELFVVLVLESVRVVTENPTTDEIV